MSDIKQRVNFLTAISDGQSIEEFLALRPEYINAQDEVGQTSLVHCERRL